MGVGEAGAKASASLVAQTGRTAGSGSQKHVAPSWQDGPLPAGPPTAFWVPDTSEEVGQGEVSSEASVWLSWGHPAWGEMEKEASGGDKGADITSVILLSTE